MLVITFEELAGSEADMHLHVLSVCVSVSVCVCLLILAHLFVHSESAGFIEYVFFS